MTAATNRRTSFLKKRSKKLLLIAASRRFKWANQALPAIDKSFLVLSFKKELLACLAIVRREGEQVICFLLATSPQQR
jgi:hypothetical protein